MVFPFSNPVSRTLVVLSACLGFVIVWFVVCWFVLVCLFVFNRNGVSVKSSEEQRIINFALSLLINSTGKKLQTSVLLESFDTVK